MIPFVITGTVGVAALASPLHSVDGPHVAVVLGLLVANVAYGVRVALRTEPSWRDGVPPLAFFLVIAALRDASASSTPTVPLLALPTLWIALYGTRRQLVLAGAATVAVPRPVVAPPAALVTIVSVPALVCPGPALAVVPGRGVGLSVMA